MRRARIIVKILHTLAAGGLIGGLGCHMALLAFAPHETPADYAELRQSLAMIGKYMLAPSLIAALVSGLLSMLVHTPYLDKGWVWLKALTGVLMFQGVLLAIVSEGAKAARVAAQAAATAAPDFQSATLTGREWGTLWIVMALAIANVVLGVWRPRLMKPSASDVAARKAAAE